MKFYHPPTHRPFVIVHPNRKVAVSTKTCRGFGEFFQQFHPNKTPKKHLPKFGGFFAAGAGPDVTAATGSDVVLPIKGGERCRRDSAAAPWLLLRPSETCRRSGEICRSMGPQGSCDGKFCFQRGKKNQEKPMLFLVLKEQETGKP